MKSLGIDIGSFSLKVVELTTSANRSYHFTGAKIYPLNLTIEDQEVQILQTLKQITKDFETEGSKVVVSLPQNQLSMRKVFFPFKAVSYTHLTLPTTPYV